MKTLAEVLAKFPEEVLTRYDFSNASYKGALVRMEGIKCSVHGVFSQYAAQLRKGGAGCPECGHTKRIEGMTSDEADYIRRVEEVHAGKGYDYSNIGFTKMNAKISVICPTHGAFIICANHHLYRGDGCQQCENELKQTRILQYRHLSAASKVANTAKDYFERCAEQHDNFYTYPEQEYKGAKHKIQVECPKHGVFESAAWDHLAGRGCRQCVHKSQPEIDITEFIRAYGVVVERGRRDIIAPKEIDMWLPEYNIGIEYHGLYHHLTCKKGKLHREKWELAQQAGVRLVQIFEDEWLNKQDIVKNRLLAFLGKAEKRDARKLKLQNTSWGEAKKFLNATHIQGAGSVGTAYGLYEGEELVAVATFGKSRSGAMTGARIEGEYEVLRYASLGTVRGGFTRLFTQFKKDFLPAKVISYCDLRYGTGGLYQAASFALDSITTPDYWWVPKGRIERVTRYAVQKHKLAKADHELHGLYAVGKTENQICAEAGWEKIHGVGNQKWVWQNKLDIP